MDILRCVLAGVASLIIGVVLLAFGWMITFAFLFHPTGTSAISVDILWLARTPLAWIVALALFVVGFIGEYRRSV
jgi:hypothetical protein